MSFVGGWKTATASFLVGSESNVRVLGGVPRRPGPSLRALLFCCGEGAVCEPCWRAGRQLVFFAVARAPFVSLVGGWKTASFLVGSESNVRHWGPLPAGPSVPQGPAVSLWRGRRL